MTPLTRRRLLRTGAVVGAVGLAGCSSVGTRTPWGSGGGSTPTSTPSPTATPTSLSSGGPAPPLADQRLPIMYEFGELRSNVQSGGPPKDGIPSIDDPTFVDASAGDEFLDPGDVVFGLVGASETRAYPQSILVWHEIVNDTIDGLSVSVTYCPLTGTALGFERGETTFGTSGNLLNNNLVMYDRGTDSRWPQVLATAVSGDLEGESLREFRLVWTTWGQWTSRHPETVVLSRDTGYARNYGQDPYGRYNPKGGYYTRESTLFPPLREDDRFHPKETVMGAREPGGAVAFPKASLAEAGVVDGERSGTTYTAVYDGRLDTAYVYRNPDGTPVSLDGERATLDGEAYAPDSLPLERIHAFDAMWFAWSGFYPETEVFA